MEQIKENLLKFYGNRLVVYSSSVNCVGLRVNNGENLKKDRKKAYKGELTKKSIKAAIQKLYAWLYVIKEGNKNQKNKFVQTVLLTLTLSSPQQFVNGHDDKFIKKNMLELLLKHLINNCNVVNYFWRAEAQANGNIHFHIVVDKWIDKEKIQKKWNEIQAKYNYIDPFFMLHGHKNPPSTQVQAFFSSEREIAYVVKYVAKDVENRQIEGLQMRFSNKLSQLIVMAQSVSKEEENKILVDAVNNSEYQYTDENVLVFLFDKPVLEKLTDLHRCSEVFRYYRAAFDLLYNYHVCFNSIRLLTLYYTNIYKFNLYHDAALMAGINLQALYAVICKYSYIKPASRFSLVGNPKPQAQPTHQSPRAGVQLSLGF